MKLAGALALGTALLLSACGGTATPVTTSAGPSAGANSVRFSANLSAANEVPAIANADASASGTATITLDVTRDSSGKITAASATFDVKLTSFPTGTTVTGSHIHKGDAKTEGAIVVDTGLKSGELTFTSGASSFTKSSLTVAPAVATDIIANPSNYYFNVHTVLNAGGAVRAQLTKV